MRILVLALLLAVPAIAGDKPKKGHPHFNDGGAIRWYTKLVDAQAVAKKEGKLVFIEYGREL